jgi:flavodoxin
MMTCVILDTVYGNTEKIARALVAGLEEAGIQTVCTDVKDVSTGELTQCDLLCVGGPTQYRTASKAMQDFVGSLVSENLAGKPAFAFDTRRDSFLAGSAAKYIEGGLRKRRMKIVRQRMSAIIVSTEPEKGKQDFQSKQEWKDWRHKSEGLGDGEEKKFKQVGVQIGKALWGARGTEQ